MDLVRGPLILLLLVEGTKSYVYNGTQCTGVLTGVDLIQPNSSAYIDETVYASLETIYTYSPWATQQCMSSLREHFCMTSLQIGNISLSTEPYCADSCIELLESPAIVQYLNLVTGIYPQVQQVYLVYFPTTSQSPLSSKQNRKWTNERH